MSDLERFLAARQYILEAIELLKSPSAEVTFQELYQRFQRPSFPISPDDMLKAEYDVFEYGYLRKHKPGWSIIVPGRTQEDAGFGFPRLRRTFSIKELPSMGDSIYVFERPVGRRNLAAQRESDGYITIMNPQPQTSQLLYIPLSTIEDGDWKAYGDRFFSQSDPNPNIYLFQVQEKVDAARKVGILWEYQETVDHHIIIEPVQGRSKLFSAFVYKSVTGAFPPSWVEEFETNRAGRFYGGAGREQDLWRTMGIDHDGNGRLLLDIGRDSEEKTMSKIFVIKDSPGARIVAEQSTDSSHNHVRVNSTDFFAALLDAVSSIDDDSVREEAPALVKAMEANQGKPGFLAHYQKFLSAVADHMTVIGPFVYQLSTLIQGGS